MEREVVSRRKFLEDGLRDVAAGLRETATALHALYEDGSEDAAHPRWIRPPGAVDEKEFLAKCTRCNECVKVCPEQLIRKIVDARSPAHLTPVLDVRRSACRMCEDFPCVRACAPAALVMPASPRDPGIFVV